jgi:hypothetical protein
MTEAWLAHRNEGCACKSSTAAALEKTLATPPPEETTGMRALLAEPHHLGFAVSGKTGTYDPESVLIKRDWYERLRALAATPSGGPRCDFDCDACRATDPANIYGDPA